MKGVILFFFTAVLLSGCGGGNEVTAASGVGLNDLVGTWDIVGSGTLIDPVQDRLCGRSFKAVLTIRTEGDFFLDEKISDSCAGDFPTMKMGTVNVSSNGSGSLDIPGEIIEFQVSRDKNSLIFVHTGNSENFTSGIAYRR